MTDFSFVKDLPLKHKWLPMLGAAGIAYAVLYVVVQALTPAASTNQLGLPPVSPYIEAISGEGLVEANTHNINVGSDLPGIVTKILVTEGDSVTAGTPLFQLDDRSAKADVALATAQVEEAQAHLDDQNDQLQRAERMKAGVTVTVDHVERLKFGAQEATAQLNVAKAHLEAAQTTLDKLTVPSPIDGLVLKVNVRKGQYVSTDATGNAAPVIVGNDKPLYVRVNIDENDLWRLKQDATAEGYLRGNSTIHFPLKFVRIEPYVAPKTSLTGATSERVDTRVMDVLYSAEATGQPLYIGQQVDVFINTGKEGKN